MRGDCSNGFSHLQGVYFTFDDAWPGDNNKRAIAQLDLSNFEGPHCCRHKGSDILHGGEWELKSGREVVEPDDRCRPLGALCRRAWCLQAKATLIRKQGRPGG